MKMRKRKEWSRFEGEYYCIKPIPLVAALYVIMMHLYFKSVISYGEHVSLSFVLREVVT